MEHTIHHHLIRTVVSLCELAATTADRRIRDDLADEAVIALGIAGASDDALRKWVGGLVALFARLERSSALDPEALAYANLRLLRLQSSLGVTAPPVRHVADASSPRPAVSVVPDPEKPALGKNQEQVLGWIRSNPGKRTHELIAHFSGTLSPRTIKRVLKDLGTMELVRRVEKDGMVSYVPAD